MSFLKNILILVFRLLRFGANPNEHDIHVIMMRSRAKHLWPLFTQAGVDAPIKINVVVQERDIMVQMIKIIHLTTFFGMPR